MSSRSLICYSAQGPNADRRCVTLRTFAAAGSTSEAELQTPDQMNFGLAAFASPVLVN